MGKSSKENRYSEFGFNPVIFNLIKENDSIDEDDVREFYETVVDCKINLKEEVVNLLGLSHKRYIPKPNKNGVANLRKIKKMTSNHIRDIISDTTTISWKDPVDVESETFKIRFASLLLIYISNNIDLMAIMIAEKRGKKVIESLSDFDSYSKYVVDIADMSMEFVNCYISGEAYFGHLFQLFCYCSYADHNIPKPKKYNKDLHEKMGQLRYAIDTYEHSGLFSVANNDDVIMDYISKIGISFICYDKDPASGIYKMLPSLVSKAPVSIENRKFQNNTSDYLNAIGKTMYKVIDTSYETYFYIGIFLMAKPDISSGYLRYQLKRDNKKGYNNIQEACYVLEYMKVLMGNERFSKIVDIILKKGILNK